MAVIFWHLVKSDLATVSYCTPVHWTSHFLQGNRNTRPCIPGHPVPEIDVGLPESSPVGFSVDEPLDEVVLVIEPLHNLKYIGYVGLQNHKILEDFFPFLPLKFKQSDELSKKKRRRRKIMYTFVIIIT